MKVKARISNTNKFREVTLRRYSKMNENGLYGETPAYLHSGRKTISGIAKECGVERWTFRPTGKYANLL